MDTATATALLEITETSRAALRHEEPGAEAPVEARYADILDALQWLLDRAELTPARRLARSLVNFWISSSRLPDGDAWFERLLAGPLNRDQDVALSLHEHGFLIFWTGDYERSGRRFAEARVMAAELGDASIEALALAGLARVALTSDVAKAVRLLREALVITEGLPDDSNGRSNALHVLGPALQMAGDFEGARAVIERRIALARTTGDNFRVWAETANLSTVERQLGNLDRAEELSLQAVASDIVTTRELFLAWTLNGLAAVTAAQGRAERAAVLLGAADALMQRAGGAWPPDELEQYDQTRAVLTRDLPADQLERATVRGQALLPDAVVNYARHDETQKPA
jgi:tetratricopeptide (TPR) repeat protein